MSAKTICTFLRAMLTQMLRTMFSFGAYFAGVVRQASEHGFEEDPLSLL